MLPAVRSFHNKPSNTSQLQACWRHTHWWGLLDGSHLLELLQSFRRLKMTKQKQLLHLMLYSSIQNVYSTIYIDAVCFHRVQIAVPYPSLSCQMKDYIYPLAG